MEITKPEHRGNLGGTDYVESYILPEKWAELSPELKEQLERKFSTAYLRTLERIMGREHVHKRIMGEIKDYEEKKIKDKVAIEKFGLSYRELEPWQQSMVDLIILREPSLLRESGMDERAKAIAEEAAAKAVLLQGNHIAQQVAKELSGEALHHSPISQHCEAVLETSPECSSFREIRSWVLCKAWDILEKEKRTKLPVGEAWQLARRTCR